MSATLRISSSSTTNQRKYFTAKMRPEHRLPWNHLRFPNWTALFITRHQNWSLYLHSKYLMNFSFDLNRTHFILTTPLLKRTRVVSRFKQIVCIGLCVICNQTTKAWNLQGFPIQSLLQLSDTVILAIHFVPRYTFFCKDCVALCISVFIM